MGSIENVLAAVEDLKAKDPSLRRRAAKVLFREARMEHTGDRKTALSRREVIEALLKSLSDADSVVVESAVGALAMTFTRYVQDDRARGGFLALTKSPRKLTRLWAATGLARLNHWGPLEPMLSDKSAEVLVQVCRNVIDGLMSGSLNGNEAASFRPGLERLTAHPDPTVRTLAENTLRTLNASATAT